MRKKIKARKTNSGNRDESLGRRLARLRKQKGLTQVELAKKLDTIQSHISGYELDRIRPSIQMIVRFAQELEVSADELLDTNGSSSNSYNPSLKIVRRMKKIESLPHRKQKAFLSTIDALLDQSKPKKQQG